MNDDFSPMRVQKKTRSASICATTGSIEAAIQNMPSGSATPDSGGTPGYRRRRPATRSQSARITGGARSVRRKTQVQQQQQQQNLQETRPYCTSEPRLSETETPPQRRKLSQRRPQHQQGQRKSNAFLDVPSMNMYQLQVSDGDDEDVDRLRTFSSSKGGVINRGDSFRRRRSRSNSLAPVSPMHHRGSGGGGGGSSGGGTTPEHGSHGSNHHVDVYRVQMLGSQGVGKAALVSQFRTSDCINAYDGPETDEAEQNISIILNGIETELKFMTGKQDNKNTGWIENFGRATKKLCDPIDLKMLNLCDELEKADAYLVVYSVVDKESFTRSKQILSRLQDMDLIRTRPIILVANKIDLARSRAVSAQDGKCLACTFGAKFIEVSVGINHNCDELLAGTLTQIRLKKEHNLLQGHRESPAHWYKSRSVVLASMKARQMITWILGKEDSKFKHCENLQVL